MVAASPTHPRVVVRLLRTLQPPPLDAFGRPLRIEDWHQRAFREDQQASGLLPPGPHGGCENRWLSFEGIEPSDC
jgi:hypothetical protein